MKNISNESCRDRRYISSAATFFPRKSCRLLDNVKKYGSGREAADNMAPARGILDK